MQTLTCCSADDRLEKCRIPSSKVPRYCLPELISIYACELSRFAASRVKPALYSIFLRLSWSGSYVNNAMSLKFIFGVQVPKLSAPILSLRNIRIRTRGLKKLRPIRNASEMMFLQRSNSVEIRQTISTCGRLAQQYLTDDVTTRKPSLEVATTTLKLGIHYEC